MWLAQMLRLESYPFFERLHKGDTLDKEATPGRGWGALLRATERGSPPITSPRRRPFRRKLNHAVS